MALIPKKRVEKVAFFADRKDQWLLNAVAMGSSTTAVNNVVTKLGIAQEALIAQGVAEVAAKVATDAANDAIDALVGSGSDVIKSVRAKAAVSGNSIYQLAGLPNPATPTPVTTLGTPSNFKVELNQDGSVSLTWKCNNPRASGTVYQVWRALDETNDYQCLGGTGSKTFVDSSIPSATATATYKIQAVRSTAIGPWAMFTVRFGVGSSGQMIASVEQPKLAA